MSDDAITTVSILLLIVISLIAFALGVVGERDVQREKFQQLCQSAHVKFVRHTEPTNWVECVRYRVEKID